MNNLVWILPFALVGWACGDSPVGDTTPGTVACEPLASKEVPTMLGNVLGIGQAADGTLYVVDKPAEAETRLFVSSGAELRRVRVAGSGSRSGHLVFTVTEHQPPFLLALEGAGTPALRMGIFVDPDPTRRDFEVGAEGDTLSVRERSALDGLALRNLAGDVYPEYLAELEDGRRLLVIRPTDDWGYGDFRLFLGTPERMEERAVASVERAKDGGTTRIRFALDGQEVLAHFPTPLRPDETATLTAGSVVLMMTVTRGQAPAGFQFLCR